MGNNAKNIKEILANDNYIIPRYQRNYAWGKAEISQLIKDIEEFFPKENNENKSYYLGSLVCFKRENGNFELIDGQQRHTTLTLINLVLKNWNTTIDNVVYTSNLKFDSRKKIQNYVENLYKTEKSSFQKQVGELSVLGTGNFKVAIELIQEELKNKDIQNFAKNFYEKVYLFRVEVPQDTDLNHYFEIMNNRGEQLEKHEIVKALLMGKIKNEDQKVEKKEQEKFAKIWDACSDMNDYVYFNFDATNRKNIFTTEGELNANGFDGISINENEDIDKEQSLLEIITGHNIPKDFPKEEKYIKDKYKSIIDFPNFLLQVLKIENDSVSLDDKKLLEQFNSTKLNPKEFIFDLLKYRTLFDKYVIKQDLADANENKQNWGIRKLNTDFETTIKTFENDDKLVKLQVMLYYSDSTNTYNNWLQEILKNADFIIDNYTEKVWDIAKGKFKQENLSYPDISIFNLYFIDFLLWKLYKTDEVSDSLKPLKDKIEKLKGQFNNFKFKSLNSKEHLFPQSKASDFGISSENLNGIGNLCLISTSQNSSGNKDLPSAKKKSFGTDNSSLKRLIMFESFENDKWGEEQIERHKQEIEELINQHC